MNPRMAAGHLIAEDEVIDRARQNDRDALGELWRIYHPQLLRFLRTKRADAIDDVASQVWIDVGRAIDGFDGGGRELQRWIFTIAHRRSIDEGRRSNRRRETPADPLDHETADSRKDSSPEAELDAALKLMATLPPNMAEAVMLRIVYELSVDETAEVMSTTAANVRVLAHRGLGKLRVRLSGVRSLEVAPDPTPCPEPRTEFDSAPLVRNV